MFDGYRFLRFHLCGTMGTIFLLLGGIIITVNIKPLQYTKYLIFIISYFIIINVYESVV